MDDRQETEHDLQAQRFSLIVGGPFNVLLGRCGLLDASGLPTVTAACVLALAAWLGPGVCAIVQGLLDPTYDGALFFEDISTIARMFIAIGVIVATERHADLRIARILSEFWEERLVVGQARARFFDLLRSADRQSASAIAQLVMLVVALVGTGQSIGLAVLLQGAGWEGAMLGDTVVLSWAGLAARWFSLPLFQFLMLLWIWRFAVLGLLMLRISRLPLQLTALHADRVAGLGFLGLYPGVFRGFVFALSCVVASLLYKDLQAVGGVHDIELLRNIGALWVVIVLALFSGPLCVFYAPLYALREAELTSNGRIVNRWYREFHSRWLAGEDPPAPLDDPAEPAGPSLGDLNAAMNALQDMRTIPLDRATTMQLFFAAVAPLLAVAATHMPIRELLGRIAGLAL